MHRMIAIDFGTSRIKLSYYDPSRNESRLMRLGRKDDPFVPSLFYLGRDGEQLYGDDADEMLETDPAGVIHTLKRKLRDSRVRANRQRVAPVDLVSMAYADLRKRAGEEIPGFENVSPTMAALTYPARYGPPEEELLRQAATDAGFETIFLVSEPEAAALAWSHEVGGTDDVVVVLDCGGGTIDWATLKRQGERFPLFAECPPGGDEKIGGHDVDEEMLGLLRERLEDMGADAALAVVEEKANYYLSRLRRMKERYCRHGQIHRADKLTIEGTDVELGEEDLKRLFQGRFVTQICKGFGVYLDQVRQRTGVQSIKVLLVGGSAQIVGLKEALRSDCNCEPVWWERSEFATVLGGVYAGPAEIYKKAPEAAAAPATPEKKISRTVMASGLDAARAQAIARANSGAQPSLGSFKKGGGGGDAAPSSKLMAQASSMSAPPKTPEPAPLPPVEPVPAAGLPTPQPLVTSSAPIPPPPTGSGAGKAVAAGAAGAGLAMVGGGVVLFLLCGGFLALIMMSGGDDTEVSEVGAEVVSNEVPEGELTGNHARIQGQWLHRVEEGVFVILDIDEDTLTASTTADDSETETDSYTVKTDDGDELILEDDNGDDLKFVFSDDDTVEITLRGELLGEFERSEE